MDFNHTEDRTMLKDMVARFVADNYPLGSAQCSLPRQAKDFSREMWAQFAELGLIGALFSESDGGFRRCRLRHQRAVRGTGTRPRDRTFHGQCPAWWHDAQHALGNDEQKAHDRRCHRRRHRCWPLPMASQTASTTWPMSKPPPHAMASTGYSMERKAHGAQWRYGRSDRRHGPKLRRPLG